MPTKATFAGSRLAASPITDDDGQTAFVQKIQQTDSDGNPVSSGGGAGQSAATTNTPNRINASTSPQTLLAANPARLAGTTIANDSTATLYLLTGNGTPSATNFETVLPPKTTGPSVAQIDANWLGAVQGVWSSATGAAMINEKTA